MDTLQMVSQPKLSLTFLPWSTSDRTTSSEKQSLCSKRHKHTALAGHRKQRAHRKWLRDNNVTPLAPTVAEPSQQYTGKPEPTSLENGNELATSTEFHDDGLGRMVDNLLSRQLTLGVIRPYYFSTIELPRNFQSMLHDALICQWPAFALSTSEAAVKEVREAAFQTATSSRHTLFAIIYAGISYKSYFSGAPDSYKTLQLRTKQEALRYLREDVQRTTGAVADSILMTIALLAIHGSIESQDPPRFTTPLYRDNEFYLTVGSDPTHLRALRALVDQRGGLEQLELHGLSNIISMVDTFQSLTTLSKPRFNAPYSTDQLVQQMQNSWDVDVLTRFAAQEDGFDFLDDHHDGRALHRITRHVRILLESYAMSLCGTTRPPEMMLMIHARRTLQHDALNVQHGRDPLFEAARLAIIIYIAHLGLTLPVAGGFQETVTALLTAALEKCISRQYERSHRDFLLWATVMGGLAAHQSERAWHFVALLHRIDAPGPDRSWLYIKSMSCRFLPFQYELAEPCHDFWSQACD